MRRKTSFILASLPLFIITTSLISYAQNSSLSEALIEMFSPLDKNKVQTGYLLDQSPDYVNLSLYNGTTLVDSNYVDIGVFGNFFKSLNGARVRNTVEQYNAIDLINGLQNVNIPSIILGIAFFEYDYIVANALQDNLISYSGGKVYDVYSNNVWQNPYEQRYACLITTGAHEYQGLSVPFSFNPEDDFWHNIDPSSLEVDFCNGSGYVSISSGFSGVISYSDYGPKEIKLRIELEDETILVSHTRLTLSPPPTQTLSAGLNPDWSSRYEETYNNVVVSAKVSHKYSSSHNGRLIKPLIYVEGFDDPNLPNNLWSFLTGSSSSGAEKYDTFIYDYNSFCDSLKVGYDAIYVDWNNPRADIKANAALLVKIIDATNAMKHQNGSSERNVIIGHSMGGLIVRYALASMEHSIPAKRHETDCYVSYDAPHLGANVPVGLQYAIRDMESFVGHNGLGSTPFGTLAQKLLLKICPTLNSIAARQMLYRWINTYGYEDNNVHLTWQADLSQLGFPRGDKGYPIENLAIINGNIIPDTTLNKPILDGEMVVNDFWGFGNEIVVSATIDRNKGNLNNDISDVRISFTKHFPWLLNTNPYANYPLLSIQHSDSPSPLYYDVLPSSIIKNELDYNIPGIQFNFSDSFAIAAFIPAASAANISDYSSNRNYSYNPPLPLAETPFSSCFVWSAAQSHSLMFKWYSQWLSDLLRMKIICPSPIIKNGDLFSITNVAGTYGSQWAITGSQYHSIDEFGVVSVTDASPAIVTISYSSSKDYLFDNFTESQILYKHKRVLAGFPSDFNVSKITTGTNTFSLNAQCNNDSINTFLDSLAVGGSITYWWGTKNSDSDIQWTPSTLRSYTISPLTITNVYFRITDGAGRIYGQKNVQVIPNIPTPLSINYDPSVVYTIFGNTYLYYSVIDSPDLYNDYFMVWDKMLNPFSQIPDRIIINNQTILLADIQNKTINGIPRSVYCFSIMESTHLQYVISHINNYPGDTAFVSGSIWSGTTWLQDFTITVIKGFPPLS